MSRKSLQLLAVAIVTCAVLGLTGCMGSSNNPVSNGDRMTAEAALTVINSNMTIALTSNPSSLPQLTQQYITAVQSSESLLGADEARQKLTATAAQLAPYCASCAQSLTAASTQITS